MTPTTRTELPLLTPTDGGCCGSGGCGCGHTAQTTPANPIHSQETETTQNTQTFQVTGMTCGQCAHAVSTELQQLDGVTDVNVDLVAGGTSTVQVTSSRPLDTAQVVAALNEAGDYHLA